MSGRLACLVDDCRRTTARERLKPDHNEWICQDHWRLVPKAMKRAKARHEREFRKFGFYPRAEAYSRVWRRIKQLLM